MPRLRPLAPVLLLLLGSARAAEPDGVWVTHHANGAKASEAEHANGGLSGALRMWDDHGQLLFEGRHDSQGEMHGAWQRWWPSGGPRMRWVMEHGRQHGPVEAWHENGAHRLRGAHLEGSRSGAWLWWADDGRLTHSCRYERGNVVEGTCADPAPE